MLYPVILAGGSGTRLWPLSKPERPKQFLSLLGGGTMLQDTLARLEGMSNAPPLVVCNESHGKLALEQLAQVGCPALSAILEPEGRNTAPALTLAALYLQEAAAKGKDAMMLAMPADNVVRSPAEFQRSLKAALPMARAGYMVTFGIVPLQPHTGYGYIRRGRFLQQETNLPAAMEVASFVEKPSLSTAQEYLRDGRYLWNSGIFLINASVWLRALNRCRPDIAQACRAAYEEAEKDGLFLRPHRERFLACPSESIDYAVMEKTAEDAEIRVAVVPLSGGWSDLGSWAQVWEERRGDAEGNVVEGPVFLESVQNSLVLVNERTVAVVGLKDAVVIETSDAVLVASREQVQEVRRIVERLKDEKGSVPPSDGVSEGQNSWGVCRKVDEGPGFTVYRMTIRPGAVFECRASANGETWTQAAGRVKLVTDSAEEVLERGTSGQFAAGQSYRLENCSLAPAHALLVVYRESELP